MTIKTTSQQFDSIIRQCNELFQAKMGDYGPAWRIFRLPSITDQIYIKANRIRTLQTKTLRMVDEGIEDEFIGIINYAVMAVIQFRLGVVDKPDIESSKAVQFHKDILQEAHDLMLRKNHDYDEAWRNMRISSLTDIILVKLLRIKQIENNQGITIISEGIDANYFDIINYAIFALILLEESLNK